MILAIDIGNSNITIGCLKADSIVCKARLATDSLQTSDQYAIQLKNVLELFQVSVSQLEGCIMSSVVPPVFNSFRSAIRKVTGLRPMIVGPGIKTGLNIRTDNPVQVGSDLIAASVAAIRRYGSPVLVVYMGTATTIAVIDANGNYLGGAIAPGLRLSLEALTQRASQLPGISLERPRRVIGRSTVDGMRSGAMFGTAAMLDGMIDRICEELGYQAQVVATGEIAKYVVPLCRKPVEYVQDLILHGLGILYDNTTGK